MDNSFQTSFIPKKPINQVVTNNKEPQSIFSLIIIFIFILTLLTSIGLFFYKSFLLKQKDSLSSSLELAKNSFDKDTIDELSLFDKRLNVSKQILDEHIVLSPLFNLLGETTIPTIQYTEFKQININNLFQVEIKGIARDYRSIALQADLLNKVKGSHFRDVLFSNLVKDKNNNITFNLKFNILPELISYKNIVLNEDINKVDNSKIQADIKSEVLPTNEKIIKESINPLPENINKTQ